MSLLHETLALAHEGDSYLLTLFVDHEVHVRSIERSTSNTNLRAEEVRFYDLDTEARHAIITQIRRRHKEKLIRPE